MLNGGSWLLLPVKMIADSIRSLRLTGWQLHYRGISNSVVRLAWTQRAWDVGKGLSGGPATEIRHQQAVGPISR